MSPRHTLESLAAAAAAITLLLAEPALAGVVPPYGVAVGTDTSGIHHPVSAHSTGFAIGPVSCTSVTLHGDTTTGPNGVNPFAALNASATWSGCTASITSSSTGWTLHGTTSATSGLTDSIDGSIDSVGLTMTISGICSFHVSGSMDMTFNESATAPTIDVHETSGHLVVSGVTFGCLGLVSNGDTLTAMGTLDVTSPDGAIDLF
jgi:hypothetical protein